MHTVYRRSLNTCWCIINGEGYLSSPQDGSPIAMNASAVLIWQWLSEGRTEDEISQALSNAFDQSDTALTDTQAFLKDLVCRHLAAPEEAEPESTPIKVEPGPDDAYSRPALRTIPLTGDYVFV